jgi:ComF family protein
MRTIATTIGRAIVDALAPERCASCDAIVAAYVLFCHACHAAVNALDAPECPDCTLVDDDPVRSARAVARYDAGERLHPIADALQAFKYRGAWRLAPRLAAAMAARVSVLGEPALVVPVPLHVTRLRSRGFNQSALLAWGIGHWLGWPVATDLVRRTRPTPSQTALTADGRRANVAGAFALRRPGCAEDRRILVVDDVWTSGATVRAVAAVLRADGAAAVDVVTFARVG